MGYSQRNIIIFFFLVTLFFCSSKQLQGNKSDLCQPVPCGGMFGQLVQFPFRVKDIQPEYCGYPGFDLTCKDGVPMIELPSVGELSLSNISYSKRTITISLDNMCRSDVIRRLDISTISPPFYFDDHTKTENFTFLNCSSSNEDTLCGIYNCGNKPTEYSIVMVESSFDLASVPKSCNHVNTIALPAYFKDYGRYCYYQCLPYGLELKWEVPECRSCSARNDEEYCGIKNADTREVGCVYGPTSNPYSKGSHTKRAIIGVGVGAFVVIILIITVVSVKLYKSGRLATRKERENQLKIEKFLDDYKSLKPTRYSYADVKKITRHFKCQLGKGGYGTVFEGKLPNGILVAVKILKELGSDGDEFINEVSTIGRIHHINVVRLLGYCADGYKRALVYEFMPNESLEKFIFAKNPSLLLGWEKLQDIAIGIARGIEYLHQGCGQPILHFDIKPQNILLDHNFNPKISDFGLAKLCAKGQSIVSMTAARGTMGYIAPEILSRNFGNASHKSDVYSYGMVLLEMIGGRKNIDTKAEHTSQVNFPEWIYNRLHQGEELLLRIVEEKDAKIAKRLTIVATWCIQWYPTSRPSMKGVVQMLEGSVDSLMMPPNPFELTNSKQTEEILPKIERSDVPKLEIIVEEEDDSKLLVTS